KAGAHQLLKQVRLFVGAFRRSKTGQRAGPPRIANALQRFAGECKRLIPRRFSKNRAVVRWIDGKFRGFRYARTTYQRLLQPMRMSDVVKAETPFDAQAFVIRRSVSSVNANDCVIGDV